MGCRFSKFRSRGAAYEVARDERSTTKMCALTIEEGKRKEPQAVTEVVASAEKKAKLDPKDFMFTNLKGETRVKPQGSINGQQFIIDNCQDCCLVVLDHSAMITVDDCTNCTILVGPVDGSLFIRDCSHCHLGVICRQFRTRDCTECDVLLQCRTRPIIESSAKINFGCYDFNYDGLEGHMEASGLSLFHNFWSYIHDFTPKEGNWQLLPETASTHDFPKFSSAAIPFSEKALISTWGDRAPPSHLQEFCFVLFPDGASQNALNFVRAASTQATLLRTNRAKIPEHVAREVVKQARWPDKVVKELTQGICTGLEFCGENCKAFLQSLAEEHGGLFTNEKGAPTDFQYLGIDG